MTKDYQSKVNLLKWQL